MRVVTEDLISFLSKDTGAKGGWEAQKMGGGHGPKRLRTTAVATTPPRPLTYRVGLGLGSDASVCVTRRFDASDAVFVTSLFSWFYCLS